MFNLQRIRRNLQMSCVMQLCVYVYSYMNMYLCVCVYTATTRLHTYIHIFGIVVEGEKAVNTAVIDTGLNIMHSKAQGPFTLWHRVSNRHSLNIVQGRWSWHIHRDYYAHTCKATANCSPINLCPDGEGILECRTNCLQELIYASNTVKLNTGPLISLAKI